MTIEQLRQFHQARPFRPFRIHLADSRHLDVEHPEFLAHTPSGRTVMVAKADETFEVIDLLLAPNGNSDRFDAV
jgi:hypothetical protein